MTRKTCTVCDVRKSVDQFPKDSRYSTGHDSVCRACKNTRARTKVKCTNCSRSYARADLGAHMKTKKCIQGEAKWRHPMPKKKQFNSRGQSIVTCPCGHRTCKGEIKELTAYRHMRYGLDLLLKPRAPPTYRQSDNERDL